MTVNATSALRRLLLLLAAPIALTAQDAPAPEPDIEGLTQAIARARVALRDLPTLWGIDGGGVDWILTDGRRHLATARVDGRDTLRWKALPVGTTIANTAVTVDGRRWAMVVLDLSRPERASTSLLVHEAMHTFQPEQLPAPGGTEAAVGGDFLDGPDGRAWLFLELRALAEALRSTGEVQRQAARDALAFRARRDALAQPQERTRLDALDLQEGIPEYTGWRLAGFSDSALADRLAGAATARVSWVRAVAYWTGPGYGYLLDQLGARGWRDAQRGGARLPELLAQAVGAAAASEVALDARAVRYDGPQIFAAEERRARANAARLDSLRQRFVQGPAIRLYPRALQISFDPNGQTPLGNDGTVMLNFRWAGSDGAELVAAGGAIVSPNWDWIQVPVDAAQLTEGTLSDGLSVEGSGWRVTVPAGWSVTRVGTRYELRPPAAER
ncbi:MAG: hypothetical protein KF689_09785 [Gemmatimonadaceae bacterium]|nr:hypothetical protein [Gemmatimonadaceae bacterium]MCW5826110.1 hypothetical protein [Gemmatimonadaceae bacterium]